MDSGRTFLEYADVDVEDDTADSLSVPKGLGGYVERGVRFSSAHGTLGSSYADGDGDTDVTDSGLAYELVSSRSELLSVETVYG